MANHIISTPVAEAIPFNNTTNSYESSDVQTAIEETASNSIFTPNTYNQTITIPETKQLIIKRRIYINARIIIKGELCLI